MLRSDTLPILTPIFSIFSLQKGCVSFIFIFILKFNYFSLQSIIVTVVKCTSVTRLKCVNDRTIKHGENYYLYISEKISFLYRTFVALLMQTLTSFSLVIPIFINVCKSFLHKTPIYLLQLICFKERCHETCKPKI